MSPAAGTRLRGSISMSEPEYIAMPEGRVRVVKRWLVSYAPLETPEARKARIKADLPAPLVEYTAVKVAPA